jgi:histidyl-tRNA synthetase
MTRVNKVRGMNDLIPEQIGNWQVVENQIKKIFQSYGYNEIRFPLIEKTELFSRGVGQSTDIVNKEMYTFEDKGGESMSLRPEGTAGCVRAALDNDLIRVDSPRLWYMGPMFRYERPQKGRSRQFHQASAEFFGIKDPFADAELLFLSKKIWEVLGISDQVELEINSLGDHQTRSSYKEALTNYFRDYQKDLDKDSLRQLDENPLRILDSKNPEIRTLLDDAPKITQFLDPESVDHHSILLELLNSNGLTYRENPQLVRGLDYYNKTVFEWKSSSLGAQDTICGGGRYDSLVEELGGKPCPAIGFSIGLERLVLISEKIDENINSSKVISFIALGEEAISKSVLIAEQLRNELVDVQIVLNFENTSASSQLKKAIKLKSDYALIVGEEELKDNTIALKTLNEKEEQKSFKINELIDQLKK